MRKFTSLLLLGFALGSFAQTPGGVSGSELWFKTAPLNSDLQGYYRWQDFSGDSIRLMLLDSRGVKSELTLPNSSVHYFNFNPSLWLADGFRSLSAKLKHGNLSQATVIGVFAPELATIGKDMVLYALDGRKGDGAILSKDKVVRGTGVEPLDYGSTSGEDLLYQSSDSLSENGFKESALRVVSYLKTNNPSTSLWGDNSNSTILLGTPYSANNMNTDYTTSLFGNNSIRGYAPELIVFSRMLTPDERRKVERLLEREEWKNPFTGANFGNLDGTPNYNQIDAIPGVISDFIPFSKAEKGLSVLKKMNAAQFSKTFKGTLSRLKPSTRGTINRGINSGIDEINSTVGSGEVMFDAIDFLKPEDKE